MPQTSLKELSIRTLVGRVQHVKRAPGRRASWACLWLAFGSSLVSLGAAGAAWFGQKHGAWEIGALAWMSVGAGFLGMALCVLALLIPLVLLTLQWRRGHGGFAELAETRRQLAAEFAASLTDYPVRALKAAKRSADAEINRWDRLRSALPITMALVAISTALLGTAAVSEAEWLSLVRNAVPACSLSVAIALLLPLDFLERLHRVSEALDEAITCVEEEAEASGPSGWLAGGSRGLRQLMRGVASKGA